MASVVFMRAVNVGGYQVCKPSVLAKKLEEISVVNVGAAGTFVVNARVSGERLRKKITEALGLEVEMMICSGEEVIELVSSKPFGTRLAKDMKGFVSVLSKPLRKRPELPLDWPAGTWGVRVMDVRGKFALSLWRRLEGERMVYPNAVVEKQFGVPATTRSWNTVETVASILVEGAEGSGDSRG